MAIHRHLCWLSQASNVDYFSPNNDDADGPTLKSVADIYKTDDQEYWSEHIASLDGLIGPLRRPIGLPSEIVSAGVVCVRDPRDALTSMFFSFTFSHGGLDAEVRETRKRQGVDKFVLSRLPDMKSRLSSYRTMLQRQPAWPTLRYEDMVLRFPIWLDQLVAGLGVTVAGDALKSYATDVDSANVTLIRDRQLNERQNSHIRSVAPGNYLGKLSQETIARADEYLSEELEYFGYSRTA